MALLVLTILPETMGSNLPETIEDVKALEKNQMPISKWLRSLQTPDPEETERETMPILR